VLERLACSALRELRRRRSVILAYHGVGQSDPAEDPHSLRIPTERLRLHIRLLAEAGFEFTTVAALAERAGGDVPPPGLAALSFDDGMADNHAILMPLLEELGITATVYVTTGLIDQPNPFMTYGSSARMMNRQELADLAAAGFELGAHTVHHPDLSKLGEDECLREMVESRELLEAIAEVPVTTFAYPYGRAGEAAVRAARRAGFVAAVADQSGSGSMYELKRAMISGKDGLPTFVLKVGDSYERLYHSIPGSAVRRASRGIRRRNVPPPILDR
jgi:peptidoglycan/xylan/chitin deacetylase (PgdA/CDA1 family)